MNAMGWVLCTVAGGEIDELWDLMVEFGERTGGDGPGVHAMPSGEPRYCVHPEAGNPDVYFRDDNLADALAPAAAWKASRMDPDDIWRRG